MKQGQATEFIIKSTYEIRSDYIQFMSKANNNLYTLEL